MKRSALCAAVTRYCFFLTAVDLLMRWYVMTVAGAVNADIAMHA